MRKIITRFAPSPTGFLHVGNLRTGAIAYLFARKMQGEFILRFDDTDLKRSSQEYTDAIYRDLAWLNMQYDSTFNESSRLDRYREVRDQLVAAGFIYPCYESETELQMKKNRMIARGVPPIYDRAALKLTPEQKAELEAKGVQPHYRFLLQDKPIKWNDLVYGDIEYKERAFSDPVVYRTDGSPTYVFCCVVDDIDYQISHIVRGADHLTNTAIQTQMFQALQAEVPVFAHLPLIQSKEGKISKRVGGFAIQDYREAGYEPMTLLNVMTQLGKTGDYQVFHHLEDLIAEFDFSKFSRNSANFGSSDFDHTNAKLLHNLSFTEIQPRLQALGIDITKLNATFWDVVKFNLTKLNDIQEWLNLCQGTLANLGELSFSPEEQDLLQQAIQVLPAGTPTAETCNQWITALKEINGRRGKELFMPLRLALTGQNHGPELKDWLILLGHDLIVQRLREAAQK